MKVGDLVKYRVPDFAKLQVGAGDNRPVGIIIELQDTFQSGGGGAWPSSETHMIISWSSDKGAWVTNERFEHIEVINENR